MACLEARVTVLSRVHSQHRVATAPSLGFTREGLYKKLKRYGLQ